MSDESGRPGRITWSALNLFASERFVITTVLDDAEIHRRLEDVVEPDQIRIYWGKHKPYRGTVSKDEFRVERIIGGGGRAPAVVGHLWNDGTRSLVDIAITQQLSTVITILASLAACVFFTITLALVFFSHPAGDPTRLLLAGIAALFWGIMAIIVITWKREVGRSKRFFRELLEDIEEG